MALISGDRAQVGAVVVEEASSKRLALFTARFYGYNATGLQLVFAEPVLEKRKVFVSVSLVDSASGDVLSQRKVRLIRPEGGFWRFASLIDFEA